MNVMMHCCNQNYKQGCTHGRCLNFLMGCPVFSITAVFLTLCMNTCISYVQTERALVQLTFTGTEELWTVNTELVSWHPSVMWQSYVFAKLTTPGSKYISSTGVKLNQVWGCCFQSDWVLHLLPCDWASISSRDHKIFTCPKYTDQLWDPISFPVQRSLRVPLPG